MRHVCVSAVPARKGNLHERARMDSTVRAVAQRILLPLQAMPFFSQAAMNRSILEKLEAFHPGPMSTWRVSRRPWFEDDRAFLRPLPEVPWEWGEWAQRVVCATDPVRLDRNHDSVPPARSGPKVWVRAGARTVEAFASRKGPRLAIHARRCGVQQDVAEASRMRPLQRRIRERVREAAAPRDSPGRPGPASSGGRGHRAGGAGMGSVQPGLAGVPAARRSHGSGRDRARREA